MRGLVASCWPLACSVWAPSCLLWTVQASAFCHQFGRWGVLAFLCFRLALLDLTSFCQPWPMRRLDSLRLPGALPEWMWQLLSWDVWVLALCCPCKAMLVWSWQRQRVARLALVPFCRRMTSSCQDPQSRPDPPRAWHPRRSFRILPTLACRC